MPNNIKRITLVGAGNVGCALADLLPKAGYAIDEIVMRAGSRQRRSVSKLAGRIGAHYVNSDRASFATPVIWLTVGDSAIRSCARELSRKGNWRNKIVLHSSGALSSDELSPLRKAGANVGSAHPMMTFVAGETPDLHGVAWAVEGDPKAVRSAKSIIRSLGGKPFAISKHNKPLYHAFGAFLSPLLVIHLASAADLAKKAGIPAKHVAAFMEPILSETLQNLLAHIGESSGPGKAFSGPLVRGDTGTIAKHLRMLRRMPAGKLYRTLVETAIESSLPIRNRAAIRKLIRSR